MPREHIFDVVEDIDGYIATIHARVSLITAGFVLGPRGSTIRSIQAACKVTIHSWESDEAARTFIIVGMPRRARAALAIIKEAIERYDCLVDGQYSGRVVSRTQCIQGIQFLYVPPPIDKMPGRAHVYNDFDYPDDVSCYSLFGSQDLFGPKLLL